MYKFFSSSLTLELNSKCTCIVEYCTCSLDNAKRNINYLLCHSLIGTCLHLLVLVITYLLLTECAVRTVSYGPRFFSLALCPKHKVRGAIKRGGKRGSITYGTDQANEVNNMFIIWL